MPVKTKALAKKAKPSVRKDKDPCANVKRKLKIRDAELVAALEQQTATSEVLRIIASTPTDLAQVLETVVANAVKLAGATQGHIRQYDGEFLRMAAHYGESTDHVAVMTASPLRPDHDSPTARAFFEQKVIHLADAQLGRAHDARAIRVGARTMLVVPLLREGTAIGVINTWRNFVEPFTERQIDLVKTFADQAVIAIENVRLFKELQLRNAETTEALEQQTATAEILKVISSSPTDIQPVFDAILENATRLCDAHMANLGLYDGENYQFVAQRGANEDYAKWLMEVGAWRPRAIGGGSVGRMVAERQPIHIVDQSDAPLYLDRSSPTLVALVELGDARTVLAVPMMKEGRVLGGISIYRSEVHPFSQKQIDLVTTFANQAVIAIENVRLFKELQARNAEVERQKSELADWNRTLEQRVADSVMQLDRLGRLKTFFAPQIAELIVAGGGEDLLKPHRREITVLYLDLRGFTAFTESAEPEDVMAVLAEYHNLVGGLVSDHQGTIEHFAGDGMMIFFNDPIPLENAPEQAVRMALLLRERFTLQRATWMKRGYALDLGMGVTTGYATLGAIGFEGRRDYAVIGSVANLAARLCGEAKGGQILTNLQTLGRVEELVEMEHLGTFTLKGFGQPISAINVVGLRS